MHAHGYKGRKFGREKDQRRALLKGLAIALVTYGKIETTLPKAKELLPFAETLITKAKQGDLAARRQLISLTDMRSAHKLMDEIAPQLTGRNSGHLRITRTRLRLGDNTQMATVSFVDELKAPAAEVAEEAAPKKATKKGEEKA